MGVKEWGTILAHFIFCFMVGICAGAQASQELDRPCAARPIEGKSVVCVCNETYCDELIKDQPTPDKYVAYTSSEGGLRFSKSAGRFDSCNKQDADNITIIQIDPRTKYQKIEGFGGAVTDSAGIHWASLPEPQKKFLIDSYCSERGLGYNMLRVPIGGSDFSTHAYAYNEIPENDAKLSNFSLTIEDIAYKIPMIKACMAASSSEVEVLGTTWSPPAWMKSNDNITGVSHLDPQFYQTYADYHVNFITKFKKAGVPVWGITTTNEPNNGRSTSVPFNDLGWTAAEMGTFISKYLGPTMRKKHPKVKILAHDDQRSKITYFFVLAVKVFPDALQYIDGVAVHWYEDKKTPPDILTQIAKDYPKQFILYTEACSAFQPTEKPKVDLGNWTRAADYMTDILEDLNHHVAGWIDWNMALDEQGGPNWVGNFVDSPVIVYAEKGEFIKQPMFYAMGHFSKFIPRGSYRVESQGGDSALKHVAVLTPPGTVVIVFYNEATTPTKVAVKIGDKQAVLNLQANSFTTAEFLH